MISLNQAIKYCPSRIKKGTIQTVKSIKLIEAGNGEDSKGIFQKATFEVVATNGPRRVTIKAYGDPRKNIFQRSTWVHCSCPWFLFYCEYALAKRGSSDIINSNGKPPNITNPKQWPYICKHVIAITARWSELSPILTKRLLEEQKKQKAKERV